MILVIPKFKNIINLSVFVTCWSRRPTNIISKVFIQIYKIKHTVLYLKYKQTIVVDVKPYLTWYQKYNSQSVWKLSAKD